MENLDGTLKHWGVKGMKWGVRRSDKQLAKARGNKPKKSLKKRIGDVARARIRKKTAQMTKIADKYHEKHKNKGVYKRQYERNLKKTKGDHRKAVLQTRNDIRNAQTAVLRSTSPIWGPAVAKGAVLGLRYAGSAYRSVATPSNIIKGKNVIMAMKNSPIRYADISKYKDIIDV